MTNARAAWQGIEDFAVILIYPNYETLRQLLPWRSYSAIRHRVRRLDIARRRHIWTSPEISRLTAAFRDGASNDELIPTALMIDRYEPIRACRWM